MTLAKPGLSAAQRHAVLDVPPVPAAMPVAARREQAQLRVLLSLLYVALVKQLILVLAYPPFQGHDEVSHFGYLWAIDHFQRVPTLYDNLPTALSNYSRFTLDWPALYSAYHPPLYHWLAWPVYRLAGPDFLTQLYAVRLVAIPFFLLTIWLAYALTRTLFPHDDYLALTVPAVIAFQPQLSFEGAIVNHDILANFFGALLLYLCVAALRYGLTSVDAAILGIALGLGLLTKATLLVFVPLVAGVALWCHWPRPTSRLREATYWRETLGPALALGLPTLLLPSPWYLFLKRTYGDFTAFQAIQALEATWNVPADSFGELLSSPAFHLERIHETWGYFGWKLLPLWPGHLFAIYAGLLLCGLGLLIGLARVLSAWWAGRWTGRLPFERAQVAGVIFLLAASLLMYAAMIYFGTVLMLTQARYLFPVAPAAAVLALLGLRALLPGPLRRPAAVLTIAAVALFNLLLLTQLVIPYAFL